jgi:hypothetical protein
MIAVSCAICAETNDQVCYWCERWQEFVCEDCWREGDFVYWGA